MLYKVVLVSAVQHKSVIIIYPYICIPLPLECPSPPLIQPLWVITKDQTGLSVLYSNFPPSIYFTHDTVHMSMLLSQFISPSPSPAMSISPFSTRVIHYRFSRFCISALIYDACFYLCDDCSC